MGPFELVGWIREVGDFMEGGTSSAKLKVFDVADAEDLQKALKLLAPLDLGVICNFGVILSPKNLSVPKNGFVNIHLGLLPDNPGRRPVQKALERGDPITGVTMHWAVEKVDAGPIIAQKTVSVGKADPEQLFEKLGNLAAEMLKDRLPQIAKGFL